MAQTITPGALDTPKVIEDKVRALPENQGLNEAQMLQKVDTEIKAAKAAGTLKSNDLYNPANQGDAAAA